MPNVGIHLLVPQQAAALLLLGIELGLVFFQLFNEVGRFRRVVGAGKNRHGEGFRGSWTKGPILRRNLALDGLGQRVIVAQSLFESGLMYGVIFLAGALGYLLNLLFLLAE